MINKRGFTIVEVLGVLIIIAILSIIVIPIVTEYVTEGKGTYNDKLSDQLKISGKSYFSDHRDKLPITKSYAYVTLTEMQSKKYITNEFKDADGNECSSSYVYVKPKTYGSTDFEYIPCLICKDKNGNVTYRTKNVYCEISEWDDVAPTCTYKQLKYSDSDNFYISDAQDMVDETKQGRINSIIIIDTTMKKQYQINTKDKDINTINIKKEAEKLFGEQSGHSFEVRVADGSYNISNVCMRFNSCIELENKTYTPGTTLPNQYANGNWTVVSDNGDTVSLAYNGVSGSGGYNNSVAYLTSNFLNPNKVLKDGKQYGCLVDQGTDKYISTDVGITDGYTEDNYWTGVNTFYNMSERHNYYLKRTGYVTGLNIDADLLKYEPYTNEAIDNGSTSIGIKTTTSTTAYGFNSVNGQVTFYNSVITGPIQYTAGGINSYWSKTRMVHTETTSIPDKCTAGNGHLCGKNDRYTYIDGIGWAWDGVTTHPGINNSTKQMLFYQCGGTDPYHGALTDVKENTDVTYYINTTKYRYDKNHQIYFASEHGTSCNDPVHDCVKDNGKYIRYYNLYEKHCGAAYSYGLTNTTVTLKYRPYIIVNKKK